MSSLGMERYPVTTNTKFTQEMKISILGRLKKIEGVQATLDDISKELCTKITAPIPFKKNHPIGNMVKEEGDLFLSLS
jgi:hypothetical protein